MKNIRNFYSKQKNIFILQDNEIFHLNYMYYTQQINAYYNLMPYNKDADGVHGMVTSKTYPFCEK